MKTNQPSVQRYCRVCGQKLVFKITEQTGFSTFTGKPLYKGEARCPIHNSVGEDYYQREGVTESSGDLWLNGTGH